MVFPQGRGDGVRRTRGTRRTPGMSSPKHERDSDRESLTGWTLVDREGTPDKTTHGGAGKDDDKDSGESSSSPASAGDKEVDKDKRKNESGCGKEEEEEELSEDLISMGKRVQEIKAPSGSDSSDIETLDCPGPDDCYEDSTQGYSSLHSSLLSSLSSFTFVGEADEGDVESLASSDVMVLDQEGKGVDEETDLSLASSPSLPDDLPAIKPDTQYRHTPDRDLNSRLNVVVALTLACVLGLGLGHFLGLVVLSGDDALKGWSSRSLWQENLNSAQIIEALNLENEELRFEITRLQENVSPIKISGKDGKNARNLRERITQLLVDNEELRVAVARQQFAGLPEGDTKAFNKVLGTNSKLRLSVGKLSHLVPDLTSLKVSANDLEKENQELQQQVGKLRYQEQPLPQELNVVAREVESLKKVVDEASKKKKAPPNFENAKIYLNYMSQVLQTLHDFKEGGLVEKLDVATDVFEGLVSGNMKPSVSVQHRLNAVRMLFKQLKSSLASKWEKIKDLSRPQHLAQVSQDTLSKMNRVIVNVVNKMKDIGQASIMKRGKASLETTSATLAQSLFALHDQFEKTWRNLEAEVGSDEEKEISELLIAEDEEVQEGEKAIAVDDGEGEAKEKKPQDARDEASENKNLSPNKAKKGDGKSGGTGGGGNGGGGGGRKDGGDGKKELEGKKTRKEDAEKKKEDKPDGRRDRSRRSRMSDKEDKKEEEKKKKKKKTTTKEEEEKAKEKKEKENKKSKKEKDDTMNKKSKNKENFSHKKENDWSRKSLQQDDKRYHKGHYNKFDKKQHRFDDDDDDDDEDDSDDTSDDDHDGKFKRKFHKKKQIHDDGVDVDDDNDEDGDEENKKKGLIRHWEKPSRKNYRREFPGPKKAFIRRRGKNATVHPGDQDREWVGRRATGRDIKRKEEQRADWLFERARHRSHKREAEHKADWQFERAKGRKDRRIEVGAEEQGGRQSRDDERLGHNKYEKLQAKRRYVRFDDDDDDDDDNDFDSDYEFYNHHHHNHHHHYNQERGRGEYKHHSNKGKREWVIPNFSATGKTYYH